MRSNYFKDTTVERKLNAQVDKRREEKRREEKRREEKIKDNRTEDRGV